ncbi:hypothetical protein Z517_02022 [Fonsecaea pedrosoi CBS 271.37]|uniref:BHLH domain-containing protein n=1 Tax=Fonsecaea pedrosoi CBS 271.37 TaxID=1442368 RepID=A0A0D2HE65_9EURO|nr:uncharacterized protein Z517_02022 [Fonsecaea pedrosoi CBS 271.37]KIW82779.1 hypothetical protein Z517_02022 [Fonsecaea pedrosoi CBS 271.37]
MSYNHSEGVPATGWHPQASHHHPPYLATACENTSLFILPDAASNLVPVDVSEYSYKRIGLPLQEAQQSRADLLAGRICLPVSSPEYGDGDHFTWLAQQSSLHDNSSDTTPAHMALARQIHQDGTSPDPCGQTEASYSSRTNAQERNRSSTSDKRQAHSITERRYRDKVNNKLKELYCTLREAKYQLQSQIEASECIIISEPFNGMKKSDVINDAITYIQESEVNFRHMAEEIQGLRSQIRHLEDHGDSLTRINS